MGQAIDDYKQYFSCIWEIWGNDTEKVGHQRRWFCHLSLRFFTKITVIKKF